MRQWRDPAVRALFVLAALAVVGYVVLVLSWRGAARAVDVSFQSPWVISGGLGGLALLGLALGAASIHLGRRQDAEHRADAELLVRTAMTLIDARQQGR